MSNEQRKRTNVFGEEEDESLAPKKTKTVQRGPTTTAPYVPPPSKPAPPSGANKAAIDIAAKRAEIQAKLAAMRSKMGAPPSASIPVASGSGSASAGRGIVGPGAVKSNLDPDLARKVADAKRMVESMQAKSRLSNAGSSNPYLTGGVVVKEEPVVDPAMNGRGGLSMASHPLLMDNSAPAAITKRDRYITAPMFSSVKANVARGPSKINVVAPVSATALPESLLETEYYDNRLSYGAAGIAPRSSMGRGHARETMKFNQKGKYVKMGEAIRAEAKMEDLKKRIMESARKAGLENEMEDQGKVVKRPAPPDVEWWDAPYLPEKTYDSFTPEFLDNSGLITIYIQHPIQIPAPSDKIKVEPKALFLTKKEQKKMRKQRRMAELKDRQDRVKMGLLAPDPPKIKLSNMMRVLTADAISDPTKIEAQVKREMAVRSNTHLKTNAERKLTDEQRREKKMDQKLKDEKKGIGAMCFKIRYLSDPAHKSKVRNNANQDGLTGAIIYNPKLCLVIVEGGMKGLKHFKHLMLNRIEWTEEARARGGDVSEEPEEAPQDTSNEVGAMGELEQPISLADNTCSLVWEGTHRERMFRGLRQYNAPTNSDAKEALGSRFEGLFDLALKVDEAEE